MRIVKGVGEKCPEPCLKGDGFISLELINDVVHVVYRTFTGMVIFSGFLSKESAKIKNEDEDDAQYELSNMGYEGEPIFNIKFTCMVRNSSN